MTTPDIGLGNWFHQRAVRTPEREALRFEGTTFTYGELQGQIDAVAGQLRGGGLSPGDRVGFLGLNQPAFLVTMFAAARLGAIFVPLNFRLTGPELAFIIGDAGVHTLVTDGAHRPVVDRIAGDLDVTVHLSADQASPGIPALDLAAAPIDGGVTTDGDDVAIIMYTSGTTGSPKGAMLTHANLWWNNTNALHNFDVLQDDVTLTAAPLFHIGGLNVITLCTLQKGGTVVLHRSFDPAAALQAIAEHRVTTMFGVPAMFQFMAQHPAFADAPLSSLRTLICGGAPCPKPLLEVYAERGVAIQQGYGLTETAPMVTFLAPEYALSKLGSSGRTPLFTEVKLIDHEGGEVREPNVNGEVWVRGPNVMAGYWNRPEATAEVLDDDGWFRTGDVAFVDEDGFLYIADRVKDMIISGGENVYPAEVESVLFDHPAVTDVAVVGTPDERWGETVTAVVVVAPGKSLSLEELREFAADRLARYKLPRRVEVIDALPRSASGKVLKFQLRTQLAHPEGEADGT